MAYFHSHHDTLFVEELEVKNLIKEYGTPCYIYSRAALTQNYHNFNQISHPHRICYAVKANPNIGILNILARLGAGFDIVSKGELARVLKAGGEAQKTVFSGVGKTYSEIEYALKSGIFCLNVESESELHHIEKIATYLNVQAPISFRINPNVDAKTHPYISTGLKENKFGLEADKAMDLYQIAHKNPHLKIQGIACHIGSQITQIEPFIEAIRNLKQMIEKLSAQQISISHLNLGGGLGIQYSNESPPSTQEYLQAILKEVAALPVELILEPGRAIVAQTGILVTRLEIIKKTTHKNFAIVDAGMNDLLRPALYSAWQNIIPVSPRKEPPLLYDVVGPLCETGDFLGKDRLLCIHEGDYLAIMDVGAYGSSMSSHYNSRAKPAEVMVDGSKHTCIRQREAWDKLSDLESILPP
jgi:diaminopimelate decarboxylase